MSSERQSRGLQGFAFGVCTTIVLVLPSLPRLASCSESSAFVSFHFSVEKYQNRFSWLKDSKFIQDLENDSVDSELLDEELSALQEEEILT